MHDEAHLMIAGHHNILGSTLHGPGEQGGAQMLMLSRSLLTCTRRRSNTGWPMRCVSQQVGRFMPQREVQAIALSFDLVQTRQNGRRV